jgi:four helix bundle protein
MEERKDILKEKTVEFALQIIALYKILSTDKKEFVMSKQLLRSATSVGANVREAKNAESKNDFIHKLSIAQKECDESLYWLELLHKSGYITSPENDTYSDSAIQILKIIRSSILTTKQNIKNT